ncbi:hypothetical protein JM93_03946 [Roseibium hamelinense]|uniref:Uncharacterized protein n=1 Tax=Roseibium hamelinense TaxID=150831 RepID=A0A562SHN9_9HYPH|nr:hypothetical protein [Roseibium hamelinense]MTI42470.1 hypothetical protein [Roseibium hamelinense]TWI80732.1 hypothetical protein JM93_03946 [Roseibium hamelinense]
MLGLIKYTLACVVYLTFQTYAAASPPPVPELITEDFISQTRDWLDVPVVAMSINAQNTRRGALSEKQILDLDAQWRSEREDQDKPLIAATLTSPLSIYLVRKQAQTLGLYTEIFVMDQNGLNVGQSAITSDYWQGDEAKFQKTYDVGAKAVFIDEPEWDEDRAIWRVQLNLTLSDVAGDPIGAATVEVNLTELQRRTAHIN